jgi:hypothetical protein
MRDGVPRFVAADALARRQGNGTKRARQVGGERPAVQKYSMLFSPLPDEAAASAGVEVVDPSKTELLQE